MLWLIYVLLTMHNFQCKSDLSYKSSEQSNSCIQHYMPVELKSHEPWRDTAILWRPSRSLCIDIWRGYGAPLVWLYNETSWPHFSPRMLIAKIIKMFFFLDKIDRYCLHLCHEVVSIVLYCAAYPFNILFLFYTDVRPGFIYGRFLSPSYVWIMLKQISW